jgi:lipoate-protein ligase B
MNTLLYRDLGRMEYLAALSFQERLVEIKQRRKLADILLVVEHPHVITIGRSGKESNLLFPGEIPVCRTSRGGDVTYHGPGQMVVYPLLDLRSTLRRDVHRYLRGLETTAIQTLGGFGIRGERMPPWTGVWIGKRKIASIGVAVKRGITHHGLALNVNTDLTCFDRIIPCGITWAGITSIEREVGREVAMQHVKDEFLRCFTERFDYTEIRDLCHEDIQTGSKSEPLEIPTTSASSEF